MSELMIIVADHIEKLEDKVIKLESENAELISLLMNHDQHEDEEWKRDYENILNKYKEK